MSGHKRSYRMGRRSDKNIPAQTRGKMSKNRWAWCKVYFGTFVIWADYMKDESGEDTKRVGDIKLVYPLPNRPPISWNLTALTVEELDTLRGFINRAFDLARPYCVARDKEAADAHAEGDDSYSRVYRSVPQLVYREGAEREYSEGVQHRSSDAPTLPQHGTDSTGVLRGDSASVAEQHPSEVSPEDDWSETDESEMLRQVGEVGDGTERVQSSDASPNPPAPVARPDVRPGEDAGGSTE